jgi:hypothetical protein
MAAGGGQLDADDLASLREWVRAQAASPALEALGARAASKTSSQRELEERLRAALGPMKTLTFDADIRVR